MNLHPAKKHECVTIVLVAFDQYSSFPRAVDSILRHTRAPFELVIIEGGAPESVRQQLEKRKKGHKHIKIIYSNHRPRMTEAFNLALSHIRTTRAFFMHNNMRVTPHWMENLLSYAKDRPGFLSPSVTPLHADRRTHFEMDHSLHAFMIDKTVLTAMGEFDEKVAAPLLSVDLNHYLKRLHVNSHKDPFTVLEYESSNLSKSFDINMFHLQWDEQHIKSGVHHMNHKWNLRLHESTYVDWLKRKKHVLHRRPAAEQSLSWQDPFLPLDFPKLGFKKFLRVLTKA